MAKALITGGAGFIGSHLVDRLLIDGHEVIAIDDFSTGRMENLSAALGHSSFHLTRIDIAGRDGLGNELSGVDWVFHCAGLADIVPSIRNPLAYHRANVDGTVHVLEAARTAGVRRFIYAASSSCYGIAETCPTPETEPARPRYPYALTKYIGEQYVMHWGKVYGLPVVSLRLFNVYGPRSRTSGAYGAVFGVFLAQKLKGKPFTVVGDGTQSRDFVFVSDVVDAFVRAAQSDMRDEIFNVGSGAPQSINRIVEILGGEKVHIPRRPGEPDCTHADIGRITKRLGWRPGIAFEAGIHVLLEHIGCWENAPVWTPESIAEATKEWFDYLGRAGAR